MAQGAVGPGARRAGSDYCRLGLCRRGQVETEFHRNWVCPLLADEALPAAVAAQRLAPRAAEEREEF
eukprot:3300185-Lingulodinium_polyedra.AAC.1